MKRIVAIFIFLVLILGCKNREERIVGDYYTDYNPNCIHTLKILKDKTYKQVYKDRDTLIVNYGRWELDKDGDIEFYHWLSLNNYGNDSYCYPEPCGNSVNFVRDGTIQTSEGSKDERGFKKKE